MSSLPATGGAKHDRVAAAATGTVAFPPDFARRHAAAGRAAAGQRLSLPLSERRLVLSALDLIAFNGALVLTVALRPDYHVDARLLMQHTYWFGALSALWFLVAAAFDIYDLRTIGRLETSDFDIFKATLTASVVYLLIPYVTPRLPGSRLALAVFPVCAVAMTMAGRLLFNAVMARPALSRRVVIVGAGHAGRAAADAVLDWGDHAFHLLGFVHGGGTRSTDGPAARATAGVMGVMGEPLRQGRALPALGHWAALPDLAADLQISTLVLAVTDEIDGELLQSLTDCLEHGVEIIPMPVLYEQLTGCVPVQYIGQNWRVTMPLTHPGTRGLYPLMKRGMDIVLGSLGLLVLGVLLPFIALAISLDSPGPLFYRQRRLGKGGRLFTVYKFRSMVADAEPDGAHWAAERDPRVTRVGRMLRRAHIDEFPQFWNVFRGEMSAVGPRPERPEFVETLSRVIPFYRVRHAVKPGMAGWGLVRQGYGASTEDALVKLQYDLYYIKHQSLWLDLVILLKTLFETVTLRGR